MEILVKWCGKSNTCDKFHRVMFVLRGESGFVENVVKGVIVVKGEGGI